MLPSSPRGVVVQRGRAARGEIVATMPPAARACTLNYPPSDLSHDVMVINGSNEVRIRDASEMTTLEEGDDPPDQTYYIICAATGVCPCPTAAFVYPAPPPFHSFVSPSTLLVSF